MDETRRKAIMAFVVLPLLFNGSAATAQATEAPSFDSVVSKIRSEARSRGISEQTLNRALDGIQPVAGLERLENYQPEHVKSFVEYYRDTVTPDRVARGRALLQQHAALLEQARQAYGVPPEIIVAIWGMETNYGKNMGNHDVIPALVTLGRDGRNQKRRDSFRDQAVNALLMLDQGYTEILTHKGSWAGAFGHTQFMPDSFLRFAVDGDGDGRKDVWTNLSDIFASTANYLAENNWRPGERWGREVSLPRTFPESLLTDKLASQINKTPDEWAALGVRLPGGGGLPRENIMRGMIIAPDGLGGPAYMVYNNFRTIMRYNSSYKYALAVSGIADAISTSPRPAQEPALNP